MPIIKKTIKRFLSRYRARRLCASIHPSASIEPEASIQNIRNDRNAIRIGAFSAIRGRLLTYGHGGEIAVGDYCFVGPRTEIWSMQSISIGNRVLISHDVNIHDGSGHSQVAAQRHQHFKDIISTGHPRNLSNLPGIKSAPIIIEDDVWISFGVIILQGVKIGQGSIVSAGSIVTHDIPDNSIYRCKVTPDILKL